MYGSHLNFHSPFWAASVFYIMVVSARMSRGSWRLPSKLVMKAVVVIVITTDNERGGGRESGVRGTLD